MPYELVKVKRGFKVQDDLGNFYSKRPLTKTMARRQQKALYASEDRKQTVRGRGFASYVDDGGNHHIVLVGNGFFSDIFAKIKSATNSILSTLLPTPLANASSALNNAVRIGYPPAAREVLASYGASDVVSLTLYRTPIQSYINSALNIITLGKWNESRNRYNYDTLFHLSLVATVSTPTADKAFIKIEKNEVINIQVLSELPTGDSLVVPVPCCITLHDMMNTAHAAAGPAFFKYDAFNNNCQIFIMTILNANKLITPEASTFVLQDVQSLLASLPAYTSPLASTLTGIAGFYNRLRFGKGIRGGMNGLTIDTEAIVRHPTSLTSAQINEQLDKLQFADTTTKDEQYAIINEVLEFLLSDDDYLQAPYDRREISHAHAVLSESRASKPYEYVNVIEKVLEELEPKLEGSGENDIDPTTGFTPRQQSFIDRERTEADKESRRKQFRDYNAQFRHTEEMQPVFAEVNQQDIIGQHDAISDENHAYLEGLLDSWKQSGKKDFKEYYYGENAPISFNPTDPNTPTSASGSPAVSAQKSAITGAWTITYADGSTEKTKARNFTKYSANTENPLEQLQKVQAGADVYAKQIQDRYDAQRASMSASDRFFEGVNDTLIGIADIGSTLLPINPLAGTLYDTFRPQTSSERQSSNIDTIVANEVDTQLKNAKTLGEIENDLFRGRLSGLVKYDQGLQERLNTETQKGTVMQQFLNGLQGSGQASVRPLSPEEAEAYQYLVVNIPGFRNFFSRNEQMNMVRTYLSNIQQQMEQQQRDIERMQGELQQEEEDEEEDEEEEEDDPESVGNQEVQQEDEENPRVPTSDPEVSGSGNTPQRPFARQLRKVGLSPSEYLKRARKAATKHGYDGRALEFSDNDEDKLMIYDDKGTPVRFGAVGYGDHILWSHEEDVGRVRKGYAEQKRRVFRKSHSAIKGNWASNKFSPNSLALNILWAV
jgi:hypothetical protein